MLRAELLTGSQSKYLRGLAGASDEQTSQVADQALCWPPTKVAAPHLMPYLASVDAGVPASR